MILGKWRGIGSGDVWLHYANEAIGARGNAKRIMGMWQRCAAMADSIAIDRRTFRPGFGFYDVLFMMWAKRKYHRPCGGGGFTPFSLFPPSNVANK